MSKSERQEKILELIDRNDIETQEDLSKKLCELGFATTQATISRDIKELKLIKVLSGGKYKYAVSYSNTDGSYKKRLNKIFKECVRSIDFAENIVVIKTLPALGSAAASALDSMKIPDVVGTIAGDDTVFVVMRTTVSANHFLSFTKSLIN